MAITLDDWQKQVLETEGNIALRSGRQVGKSTVISIKAAEFAATNPNKQVLVVASVERQAQHLFGMTLTYLEDNYGSMIKKGKDRPTKHIIQLRNGSIIRCLPTGLDGHGVRGYTTHLLIVDEAAFLQDAVFDSLSPQLAVTKGTIILLSTPFGKNNFFYRCFDDPSFTTFHISSLNCPRRDDHFLEEERKRMGKLQFLQEYGGEFCEDLTQWFGTDLIKKCMVIDKGSLSLSFVGDAYLGVDCAAKGEDQTVLVTTERVGEKMRMRDMQITQDTMITDTIRLIKEADHKYKYSKIYIDSGGLGVGVSHPLLQDDQTKRKVIEINNAQRSLDREDKRKVKYIKEDLYVNCLRLMEQGRLKLLKDDEVFNSLKSVQSETKDGKLMIFGENTHVAEALIRAVHCMQERNRIFCIK